MVLVLKEANLTSVSCEVDVEDDGKQPFEKVRDRSLSYIDVRCQEHWLGGNSKIFENIYKFGRPRQRISDVLAFDEFEKDERLGKKRYHFGQCLVLPEALSTFSLKEEIQNNKKIESTYRSTFSAQLRQLGPNNFIKNKKKMFFNDLRKDTQTAQELYGFENEMYRWSETPTENRSKKLSRRSLFEENGNMSWKSGKTVESRKELAECYNRDDDNEVQINSRFRKDFKKTYELNDEYSNRNTLENRNRNQQVFDEVRSIDARISDIRENWRLRVARENEAKQSNLRLTLEREKNQKYVMDEDEWSKSFKSTLIAQKEKNKKELHRSKSTPDMLEEIGRRKLEIWVHDEPKRNGSLMDVYNKSWEVYNDQQEADSLNEPNSLHEPVPSPDLSGVGKSRNSGLPSGKNFFEQFLTSRIATPMEMFSNTEPFSQFWVILSNIYGQALIILMFAFSLTEVMDNSVKLLSLQGIFLMYLYVGSIAVIICIYIWVLIDSCSSIQTNDAAGLVPPTITTSIVHDREAELQNISTSKFGSLKKAHITRDKSSNTSFYLRIGAIAFGLGTLVFNGLEMAMHSMMEGSCLNDVVFVHPILHGLFTFLQMHFLFVNSQVLVERFGLVARFGFMHLAATNLALWIRLVIWESGNEWTHYVHLSQNGFSRSPSDVPTPLQLRSFPKFIVRKEREINFDASDNGLYQAISKNHISQVVSLHQCLNNNSLGQLWTSSMPFLYPFIIQFSLIAAAVTYIMGQNVAKDRLFFQKQKKSTAPEGKISSLPTVHDTLNSWSVDCGGASKGLFLGILCLVTGVVVIIIFLVVKENEDFPSDTIFWLTSGTLMTILSITTVVNVVGLIQIRKLSVIGTKMTPLDKILSVVSVLGVQLYTILGIVVGASGMVREFGTDSSSSFSEQKRHGMLLAVSLIQLLQTIMQASFAVEGIRRTTLSRTQTLTKPARQVITFLIFSNAVLWAFDTFVVQSWVSQELQLRFFGVLAWGVISRLGLPLLVFYRFHSCVLLLEIWKKSYQSLHLEAGN